MNSNMPVANLTSVNHSSGLCVYELGRPFWDGRFGKGYVDEFDVYSRPGFTKVRSNGMELTKSLGVKSHRESLEDQGYYMMVSPRFLTTLSDDELLRLFTEFEFTGDDLTHVLLELNNR